MNKEILYHKLTGIFREVFENDALVVTPELTAHDVAAWDSLNHIRLIVSIEEAFGITFSAFEVSELKKVGDWADLILSKLEYVIA